MDSYLMWSAAAMMVLVGMALGATLYAWWLHRAALARRRVPRRSPIVKRALVSSREIPVWRWLVATFPQHHVMVKMPVTRFTTPQAESDRAQWFALLSDVYCTFTLATPGGTVMACFDVPGPNGIPLANLAIKRKLFARCEVPYRVLEAGNLPDSQELISALVRGKETAPVRVEAPVHAPASAVSPGELHKARAELQAAVSRQRRSKSDGERASVGEDQSFADSMLPPDWAPDSFQMPLDSRKGDFS